MTIPTAPSMDSKTALALRYAERWVTELSNALTSADVSALLSLLQPSAWFRDLLVFTWDIRSTKGHNDIRAYLLNTLPKANISGVKLDLREGLRPRLEELGNGMGIVDVAFTFETPRAHGRGCAKALVPLDSQGEANGADAGPSNLMKAMCVMFMVNDWKGYEEINYETKLPGGHTLAWQELINQKREEVEKDPQVVISCVTFLSKFVLEFQHSLIRDFSHDSWIRAYRVTSRCPSPTDEYTCISHRKKCKSWG